MSLFSRTVNPLEDEAKIAIHLLQSVISEVSNERLTVDDANMLLGLSDEEKPDLIRFLTLLSASPDKIATGGRTFNYLCMGEFGITTPRDYHDEDLFWQMLEAE